MNVSKNKKSVISLGLVQQNSHSDYMHNVDCSIAGIREASARGAELVVLQELHARPYFCQEMDDRYFDWAETIPGATSERFAEVAKELKLVLVCSLFEKQGSGLYYNTAVVLEQDGTIAGLYRKMHIPNDPGYFEKYYFAPGDLGFTPISTSRGRVGILVCWDQWFPEAARLLALRGSEILVSPTAIGWDLSDTDEEKIKQCAAWKTICCSHAIANHIPVAVCNRVGLEETEHGSGILFWGSSFIADPMGGIIASGSDKESAVIVAEIDLGESERQHLIWPFFRDRRVDAYGMRSNVGWTKRAFFASGPPISEC